MKNLSMYDLYKSYVFRKTEHTVKCDTFWGFYEVINSQMDSHSLSAVFHNGSKGFDKQVSGYEG